MPNRHIPHHLRLGLALAFAAASAPGVAAPAQGEAVVLDAPAPDPADRLREAAAALEGELGPAKLPARPKVGAVFSMMAQRFGGDPTVHLLATPADRSIVCHARAASADMPALQGALSRCLAALTAALKAGRGGTGAAAGRGLAMARSTPTPAGMPLSPPAHQANWAQVAGVYFRQITIFGVGGIPVPDFQPVVLFKDGSFYEANDTAIEDLDLAASRVREPRRWGTWSGGGATFTLKSWGPRAEPITHTLQKGSFFKAFPAEVVSGKLDAKYTRVSGGGDSGLGGSVTVGGQTDTTFRPDGTYGRVGSGGGMGAGVAVSSRSADGGRYRITGHRIETTGPDGRTRRRFFALGSKGSPPRVDPQIIFIGGNVHTIMDGK